MSQVPLVLAAAAMAAVSFTSRGGLEAQESSASYAGGAEKVKICHIPPGNPEVAHVIEVSENALEAHLNHGDCLAGPDAVLFELCDCTEDPPDFPGCEGATCGTFTLCNAESSCGFSGVCGTSSEDGMTPGAGLCVDGSTPCFGLTLCPNGRSDCEEDELCFINSCCGQPVCVGVERFCSGADQALYEEYPEVFAAYYSRLGEGASEAAEFIPGDETLTFGGL